MFFHFTQDIPSKNSFCGYFDKFRLLIKRINKNLKKSVCVFTFYSTFCKGYDSSAEYSKNPNWFGVTIGRVAGRITNARFSLDGHDVHVSANNAMNSLHGGHLGLSRVLWRGAALPLEHDAAAVRFTHTNPDGTDGYTGTLSRLYCLSEASLFIYY